MFVLPQGSLASHVRVATKAFPQVTFVTVLRIVIVATPQLLLAVGVSNLKLPAAHSFVLFPEQVIVGAMVETVAIVWLQLFVFPQGSMANHVRVATKVLPQPKLVTVFR